MTQALASVAHYLPLDVAARRLAESGRRLLVVVRGGVVSGLIREQDLLDPSRRSEPEIQAGRFASQLEPSICWLNGPPRGRREG